MLKSTILGPQRGKARHLARVLGRDCQELALPLSEHLAYGVAPQLWGTDFLGAHLGDTRHLPGR